MTKHACFWALAVFAFWLPGAGRADLIEAVTEDITQARGRELGKGGPDCQSLANVSAPQPVRAGRTAFQHRVMRCGERSELAMRKTVIGQTYWYGWSLFLPADLGSGGICAQWATYPKKPGRTFPRKGSGSYLIVTGDTLVLRFQHKGSGATDAVCEEIPLGKLSELKNKWIDFVLHVKWTGDDDGFLKLWMSTGSTYADPKINYKGPTYWNDEGDGPYFKMGRYNGDPGWKGAEPGIWYTDEYRLGDAKATFSDVAPPKAVGPYTLPAAATLPAPLSAARFAHPGMLNSAAELAFIKAQVKAGAALWKAAYAELVAVKPLDHAPKPVAEVSLGEKGAGHAALQASAKAVYAAAVLWSVTGEKAYAKQAIAICNAWSHTLKAFLRPDRDMLAIGEEFTPMVWGAEIIRHTDAGWAAADVARFENLLRDVVWPVVKNGGPATYPGNWHAWANVSMFSIAIFTGDRAKLDHATAFWKHTLATYVAPTGKCGETCRDLVHSQMGLGALAYAAEMAWHQNIDLYGHLDNRLLQGAEYHATLLLGEKVSPPLDCPINYPDYYPIWEPIYNHYHRRKGLAAPKTEKLLLPRRPEHMYYSWNTLTHGGVPR